MEQQQNKHANEHSMIWSISSVLLLSFLVLSPSLGFAEVRALIVGINHYDNIPNLHGAVNDARDIAAALARLGIKDRVLLLDREANRQRIEQAWRNLLSQTQSDDQLIFTFAGHGSQEEETIKGQELYGKNSVFLLSGFTEKGQGTRERIIDDELYDWLKEADSKHVPVIFVADSCHSGTMTRGIDPRVQDVSIRSYHYTIPDDEDELDLDAHKQRAQLDFGDFQHLTYLGASQDHEKVKEVRLANKQGDLQTRGALSYFFARAIEGKADQNQDSQLTRGELFSYLKNNIRSTLESKQTPNFMPTDQHQQIILAVSKGVPTLTPEYELPISVIGTDQAKAKKIAARLNGVRLVDHTGLIRYDFKTGDVLSDLGDPIAYGIEPNNLQAIVDKWQALEQLKHHRTEIRLKMELKPDDTTHLEGSPLTVLISERRYAYFMLMGINSDGIVALYYPYFSEETAKVQLANKPHPIDFKVEPPFGADHLIAVASETPLTKLIAQIKALNGTTQSLQAVEQLKNSTQHGAYQIGLQSVYTRPNP